MLTTLVFFAVNRLLFIFLENLCNDIPSCNRATELASNVFSLTIMLVIGTWVIYLKSLQPKWIVIAVLLSITFFVEVCFFTGVIYMNAITFA